MSKAHERLEPEPEQAQPEHQPEPEQGQEWEPEREFSELGSVLEPEPEPEPEPETRLAATPDVPEQTPQAARPPTQLDRRPCRGRRCHAPLCPSAV